MAEKDGKTYKCMKEFRYNGILYNQCTHAGKSGDNHHKDSWCRFKKNGGHDWGKCKGG